MSSTVLLLQTRDGTHMHTKSLGPWRPEDEDAAREYAAGDPVIALDIDYPWAEVSGPVQGEWMMFNLHEEAAHRIVALGGRIWQRKNKFAWVEWSIPRRLDPDLVREVFDIERDET